MYQFGVGSRRVRKSLDPRLQDVVDELIKRVDISLIWGHRTERQQNDLYAQNKSQVRWPNSKHNSKPSLAVDLQPYPYPSDSFKLRAALGYIAGMAMHIAEQQGTTLRWGGDWNMDGSTIDNRFDDLFHLEIVDGG